MNVFKTAAIRLTALLLFFVMIAAVILYQAGVYDIAFIKRPLPPLEETTDTGIPSDSESEGPGTDSVETDPPATESDTLPDPPPTPFSPEDIPLFSALYEEGYRLTDRTYGRGLRVVRLDSLSFGGEGFSLRKVSVTKQVLAKKTNDYQGVQSVTETVDQPRVSLYFGLILLDTGKSLQIYNTEGTLLLDNFTGMLAMARSVNGRPVVQIRGSYYEIEPKSGLLDDPIPEEKINFKALAFDMPSGYATSTGIGLYPFSTLVDELVKVGTKPKPTTAPEDSDPADTDPEDTSAEDTSAEDTGSKDTNTEDIVPEDTNPEDTDPEDTNPADTETDNTEPGDTNPADTTSESTETVETVPTPALQEVAALAESEDTDSAETEPEQTEITDADGKYITDGNGTLEIDGVYYKVVTKVKWGYKNAAGTVVIEPQYAMAYEFSADGLAAVTDESGSLFFINTAGKEVVSIRKTVYVRPPELSYTRIRQFYYEAYQKDVSELGMYYYDRGYVMVRYSWVGTINASNIYGDFRYLLDTKGKRFEIPGGYRLCNYSDGILLVEKDGLYGYMDLDGGWVSDGLYTDASPFLQGLAVCCRDGKYGMIDTEGNTVLPFAYEYLSDVSSGVIAAYSEARGWELYGVVIS